MGRKLKNNNNRFSGWSAYRSSPPEHNTRKRKPKQSEESKHPTDIGVPSHAPM